MSLAAEQIVQGRYRIISRLSQGGMGVIYRAHDLRLNMTVALKEMVPQPDLDPRTLAKLRDQFQREALALAQLDHPHLVDVIDFFQEGDSVCLVMKFIEGESLAARIERQGALPEEHVLAWARQLLDALIYCHGQRLLHRDIKPLNIIIRSAPGGAGPGQAMLVDFGLVKLWDPHDPHTRTVIRALGTPHYIPPEQYDEEMGHTDARSDIYSLGATLYCALSGQTPPTATQRMADQEKSGRELRRQLVASPQTQSVILKALELSRARRWQSAAEMKQALDGTATRRRAPVWGWALGGMVGLLVLVTVLAMTLQGGADPRPTAILAPTVATATRALVAPTVAPTETSTPTETPSASSTPTRLPTRTPTATESPSKLPTPTRIPTRTPVGTETPTALPTLTPTATRMPLPSPTATLLPPTATSPPPTSPPQPTSPPPTLPPPTSPPQPTSPPRPEPTSEPTQPSRPGV